MYVPNHIQAVEDGTVIEVFLGVASRTSNAVTSFGELESVTVDGTSGSFLSSSILTKKSYLEFSDNFQILLRHTVRNLPFLSKNSTLISRENCRFSGGQKLVKMLWFWTF